MCKNKKLAFVVASIFLSTLWGCGSNMDSGGDSTAGGVDFGKDPAGVAFVGAGTCIGCHKDFSWSADVVADYLAGKHVIHSDHIDQKTAKAQGCSQCHDPIGDGPTLEKFIDPANVPAGGLAAIGCENCHGAGGEHYGIGPIPTPIPDYNACGQCHAVIPDNHLVYHPEANNIVTKVQASGHFTQGLRGGVICAKCHTDEGAKLYRDVDTVARLETLVLPVENPSPIQCRTCHNPHNAGELLEAAITSGSSAASAEYRTCTNCHQAHDVTVVGPVDQLAGSTSTDGASADGSVIYHAARWNRIIASTHYDKPATTGVIEGYTMKKTNERACRDCHDVHLADITINQQWANSAHGGHILEAKEAAAAPGLETVEEVAAIQSAGATDATAPAWVHYDWDSSSRQSCQRCHTATGAKNFMSGPATYTAANNDFSHLAGWSKNPTTGVITSSGQNEMLYCWACHANNSGALRNPGAITEIYEGTVAAPLVTVAYPDVAGSNICMTCHLGRETGAVVKTKVATTFTDLGFINSHYLSAGGQLFATTGYEFAGRNYNNVPFFAHDKLGTTAQPNTGVNGPCVSCHMSATEKHLFLPVAKDELTGQVTAVTSTVCNNCHPGLSAAEVNSWKNSYAAALEALNAALASKGVYFYNAHPYFFTAPYNPAYVETGDCDENLPVKNWQTGGTSTFTYTNGSCVSAVDVPGTAGTGMDNMGVAFNLNLLLHDPGGYAHNQYYVKGLIWDSIDLIFDGTLNNDVPAALPTLGLDPATLTAAQSYLGTTRPGDTIRPGIN